jgi:hypothetical protein
MNQFPSDEQFWRGMLAPTPANARKKSAAEVALEDMAKTYGWKGYTDAANQITYIRGETRFGQSLQAITVFLSHEGFVEGFNFHTRTYREVVSSGSYWKSDGSDWHGELINKFKELL